MRTSRHLRLGLLPLLAALSGCSDFVEGNGIYAERIYEAGSSLPEFSRAAIGFDGDVDVTGHPPAASIFAATQPRRVVLSGDENVIEHIQVKVDGSGRLSTTLDVEGYSSVHPPQLLIHAPGLVAVEALGGSDVTVQEAPAGDFAVAGSAKGHVVLKGSGGGALSVTLSGGAVLDAATYAVQEASLSLSGASAATVWPVQPVTGSADGGSTVLVKGTAGCDLSLSGGSTCGPLD